MPNTSHRAAKNIIAKRVACDIAGWHDDPLCNDPECWVCDEGRRVADWILRDLLAAGYSICLVGRPDAPKVRDVL